jgi:hypothetical protein
MPLRQPVQIRIDFIDEFKIAMRSSARIYRSSTMPVPNSGTFGPAARRRARRNARGDSRRASL